MRSSIGSRTVLDRYVLTLVVVLSGCASSGDAIPPAATPEPLAMVGPMAVPRASRTVPQSRPVLATRRAMPAAAAAGSRAAVRRTPASRVDSAALERAV